MGALAHLRQEDENGKRGKRTRYDATGFNRASMTESRDAHLLSLSAPPLCLLLLVRVEVDGF